MRFKLTFLLTFIVSFCFAQLPKGFVYVKDIIPNIEVELRYCTDYNFVGKVIDGYEENKAILTVDAVNSLKKAQAELNKQNLSLKIYDSYRPQRAVNHFVRWAKDVNDTVMKAVFYPKVKKKNLFKAGYIASKSRHSSGSTVDITIVDMETGKELDMGSPYDFFGSESWIKNSSLNRVQRKNRSLLQKVMKNSGFRNYLQEWWHFTLREEPYRNQYFDFVVK